MQGFFRFPPKDCEKCSAHSEAALGSYCQRHKALRWTIPFSLRTNKVANLDKHRLVITIAGLAGVHGDMVAGTVTIKNCFFGAQAGQEIGLVRMPANTKFHGNLKPVLKIEFGESIIPAVYRKEVISELSTFAKEVALIVDKIEKTCP